MDKQAILNFLRKFQSNIKLFQNCNREYFKFYTSYLRETPIDTTPTTILPFKEFELSFLCSTKQIEDNLITEDFLLNHLKAMFYNYCFEDEVAAIAEIVNKESKLYSEINVLNEPFTKESLEKAIAKVLTMVHFNKSVIVKPKLLLVSPDNMWLSKDWLRSLGYEGIELIVNPYIRSSTFAAIITDVPNSFRHYVKKPMELSVVEYDEGISVGLTAESFFETNEPTAICIISF